jgi:uncharacterized membrane-anchored protein
MLSHAVCSPAHRLLPLVRETDGAARTEQAESRRRHPAASLSRRRVSADTVARKVSATVASKVGTTLAHFADRSLGIGYLGGSLLLLGCVLASLALWYRSEGTVSVDTVSTPRAEGFYWLTITFSQSLGTALGDWVADAGLGYRGGALVFGALLALLAIAYYSTRISRVWLFWAAFILTRPLGATVGDFFDKPIANGGLNVSRPLASAIIAAFILICLLVIPQRPGTQPSSAAEAPPSWPHALRARR